MTFIPGDPRINRKGRPPGKSEKDKLMEALQKEGEKRDVNFYEMVAKSAFSDKGIMAAVLKKLVPDMTKTEIDGKLEVTEMPKIVVEDQPLRFNVGAHEN